MSSHTMKETGLMTPLRIGDDVRVTGADTWFAGAEGTVTGVYIESGTYMIELRAYRHMPKGLTLPFAASELEAIRCQHPQVTETELSRYIDRRWYAEAPYCPDCNEWLYPDDTEDGIRVYVGEPRGAGADVGAW